MTVTIKARAITESEVIEIMEAHGWNAYGIESMADEIAEHMPMTKGQFLAYLADYEDDEEIDDACASDYYMSMLEMMYN